MLFMSDTFHKREGEADSRVYTKAMIGEDTVQHIVIRTAVAISIRLYSLMQNDTSLCRQKTHCVFLYHDNGISSGNLAYDFKTHTHLHEAVYKLVLLMAVQNSFLSH